MSQPKRTFTTQENHHHHHNHHHNHNHRHLHTTSNAETIATSTETSTSISPSPSPSPEITSLAHSVCHGDRVALSRAITLIESTRIDHRNQARQLLSEVLTYRREMDQTSPPPPRKRLRIGISGPPGVGKSTFIEALGTYIVDHYRGEDPIDRESLRDPFRRRSGKEDTTTTNTTTKPIPLWREEGVEPPPKHHTLAVLSIDPSSHRTGGSILGDKTRMTYLTRAHDRCYIRPSPSRGLLGGVASHTAETIFLCESAGYDITLIETVGVGQSEVDVCDMVDCMILLVAPAGGDELQGMKKGIVEMADMVIVNKADGDMLPTARNTKVEYMHAMQLAGMQQSHEQDGWMTPVLMCSSVHTDISSIKYVWDHILLYLQHVQRTCQFSSRRAEQGVGRMWRCLDEQLMIELKAQNALKDTITQMTTKIQQGKETPTGAANQIIQTWMQNIRQGKQ